MVPGGFPSTQLLPVWRNPLDLFDELHTAGERVKQLDCQGEKGRARNNGQTKKNNTYSDIVHMRVCIEYTWIGLIKYKNWKQFVLKKINKIWTFLHPRLELRANKLTAKSVYVNVLLKSF